MHARKPFLDRCADHLVGEYLQQVGVSSQRPTNHPTALVRSVDVSDDRVAQSMRGGKKFKVALHYMTHDELSLHF